METVISKFDVTAPDQRIIDKAANILKNGGLVAFPTETVYGLGGNGLDADACKKIYQAKGRPSDNPLILHIADMDDIYKIVSHIPETASIIMEKFWPGPITIIFPKAECVPVEVTGGFDTVAVRFPSNEIARAIIRQAGMPVAAPSANSSGKPSPTKASHVEYDLKGKIGMIVDGGSTDVGLESTIIDVTGEKPMILRPGGITKEMLEEVLGEVLVDPAVMSAPHDDLKPKAPGMKYTHYCPKAKVVLVSGEIKNVIQKINQLTLADKQSGLKVGVMATEQTKNEYISEDILSLGDANNIEQIGANLFKTLRKFDFLGVDIVYSEVFDLAGEGMAIMNRLNKAAGYNYIKV